MLQRNERAERVAEHGIVLKPQACRQRIDVSRQPS
jgi:hypothetical protein